MGDVVRLPLRRSVTFYCTGCGAERVLTGNLIERLMASLDADPCECGVQVFSPVLRVLPGGKSK